jgi:hypothetical protein
MTDILARLKAATGPSRELDAAIGGYTVHTRGMWTYSHLTKPGDDTEYQWSDVLLYTASIDAALTLVTKGMHWTYSSLSGEAMLHSTTGRFLIGDDVEVYGRGPTPAIALLIAIFEMKGKEK